MDIFTKCENFTLAKDYREKGIYPYFHALESRQDVEVIMEGKRRIMLGSNNYLGLTTQPEVVEAGIKAFERYGTGCSGSRFLNGTLEMHLELEAELASFVHKEGAVTFSTGFQSNLGIISAIVGRNDYVICDRENHASIYDGCKLSYGKMLRYKHADMADLEAQLQRVPGVVSPGAGDHRDTAIHPLKGKGHRCLPFMVAEGGAFPCGGAHHQSVGPGGKLPVDQRAQRVQIKGASPVKRRHQGGCTSVKNGSLHHITSPGTAYVPEGKIMLLPGLTAPFPRRSPPGGPPAAKESQRSPRPYATAPADCSS